MQVPRGGLATADMDVLSQLVAGAYYDHAPRLRCPDPALIRGEAQMAAAGPVSVGTVSVSRYQPGDTFLGTGPRWNCTVRPRNTRIQAITLPCSVLTATVASAWDSPQLSWDFRVREPVPGGAQRWRNTARYAGDVLSSSQSAAAPLVISSVAQLLAATVLAVFPNNALTDPTIEDRHDAHSATVRRAVAFIDEHAHEDISVLANAVSAAATTRSCNGRR